MDDEVSYSTGVILGLTTQTALSNLNADIPKGFLTLKRGTTTLINLIAQPKEDGASRIGSRLQVGFGGALTDQSNMNTLAVNGNIHASEVLSTDATIANINTKGNTALTTKKYVDDKFIATNTDFVDLTTDQTIAGDKIFTGTIGQEIDNSYAAIYSYDDFYKSEAYIDSKGQVGGKYLNGSPTSSSYEISAEDRNITFKPLGGGVPYLFIDWSTVLTASRTISYPHVSGKFLVLSDIITAPLSSTDTGSKG